MFLSHAEADAIDAQILELESRTGVQVVTAIVGKSDTYVELPWKAFALGASIAAFGVVAPAVWQPHVHAHPSGTPTPRAISPSSESPF